MATQSLQPGASPANPAPRVPPAPGSFARRAILGAFAATPLLALPASAAAADTAEWQTALRDYRLSVVAHNAALEAHSEIESVYFAEGPTRPVYVVDQEGDYGVFGKHVLPLTVREDDLTDPTIVYDTPERTTEMREGFATYHRKKAALKERIGYNVSDRHRAEALNANSAALDRLLAIPASTTPMLVEKVEIIIAEYDDADDRLAGVLADLRRLSGEVRS